MASSDIDAFHTRHYHIEVDQEDFEGLAKRHRELVWLIAQAEEYHIQCIHEVEDITEGIDYMEVQSIAGTGNFNQAVGPNAPVREARRKIDFFEDPTVFSQKQHRRQWAIRRERLAADIRMFERALKRVELLMERRSE